ncbi:formin-2-like [Sinocyclocheilus anshuiensis]|uniref:formin-2-like n=1 Tax=Sinocyclocheilus anshuiensis TaxID=1608454 RepID=UPI0007BA8FEA|nr:PREDICTED: formin-2-like [Sinocyclocheilus anshuiensis]
MRDNSCKESIDKILQEAPTARKALLDNHSNLHKVADYCQSKYLNVEDTRSVIEESKALTTQALASVTYQINNLATSVLKILDAQTVQLNQIESSVNLLTLTVGMYKEKLARKEIGVLTKQSKVPRTQKVVPPVSGLEPSRAYRRVPISYTRLDKLGHSHWEGSKTEEPKTDNEDSVSVQLGTQETSTFNWSFLGIAVPPPSVPDWVGSSASAPPDLSPASPPPSLMSDRSPSLPAYPDLSMLPPPSLPDDEMGDAPPPPPPPSPPPPSSVYGGSLVPPPPPPPGQNTSLTSANPPPPAGNMAIPPPPPPPPGNVTVPPPPPHIQGKMAAPPPPPPPPGSYSGSSLPPPPPPPPPGSYSGSSLPPPPPPQNASMVPPPPPPNTGGKFIPPPPPPPPPF